MIPAIDALRRWRPWRRAVRFAIGGLVFICGCSADVRDGLGPSVPEPDVEGVVSRGTTPAIGVGVELHNVPTEVKVFDTKSNRYGAFLFFDVNPGLWEVRAESNYPGDFASVSHQFYRADGDGRFRVRDLDVFAYGAALVSPAGDASVTVPTPFNPLDFLWSNPDIAGVAAQVQLYDHVGERVWRSSPEMVDSVRWYGYGSEGSYQGVAVGAGLYEWRVRFQFPDTTEARTVRRLLWLQ